jgi:DnaK suppressor protein
MAMDDKDRKHLEQRLLHERERTNKALDRYQEMTRIGTDDDGELTQYKQHPADEGTDTMEQEQQMLLLAKEGEQLGLIDEALRRLYKEPETYGRCDNCGAAIEVERLDLVPWARLCLSCQTQNEAGR